MPCIFARERGSSEPCLARVCSSSSGPSVLAPARGRPNTISIEPTAGQILFSSSRRSPNIYFRNVGNHQALHIQWFGLPIGLARGHAKNGPKHEQHFGRELKSKHGRDFRYICSVSWILVTLRCPQRRKSNIQNTLQNQCEIANYVILKRSCAMRLRFAILILA